MESKPLVVRDWLESRSVRSKFVHITPQIRDVFRPKAEREYDQHNKRCFRQKMTFDSRETVARKNQQRLEFRESCYFKVPLDLRFSKARTSRVPMDPISRQLNEIWTKSQTPPDVFRFLSSLRNADEAEIVSVIQVDQTHRWKTTKPLLVEEYLVEGIDGQLSRKARVDLALSEFRARGLRPMAEHILEYLTRFPELRKELTAEFSAMASANQTLNELSIQFDLDATTDSVGPFDTETSKPTVRYELRKVLGEGAFGKVYLGYDHELERPVAIKFPKDERLVDTKHRETYLAEARTVASLNHPNIVPVYDIVRREDGALYIVSKYIDGCTLEAQIRNELPSFRNSAFVVASIATALEHAHQCHLIHRDVKPGNILLEAATGNAYITDFGLAIKGDQQVRLGRVSGTPPYMSPEQVRGDNRLMDGRSDIFSLGAILYELLTGQRAFSGETPQEVFRNITEFTPSSPRSLNPSVPEELERICLKALSKDVEQRYATAGSLASDLIKWQRSAQFDTLDDENRTYSHHDAGLDTRDNKMTATVASRESNRATKATPRQNTRSSRAIEDQKNNWLKLGLLSVVVGMAALGLFRIFFDSGASEEANSGMVQFETVPSSARIEIRKEGSGQVIDNWVTDRSLRLAAGNYRVRISAEGYQTKDETMSLSWSDSVQSGSSDKSRLQSYTLDPLLVALKIRNLPPDTRIRYNGEVLPYDSNSEAYLLPPGKHTLRYENDALLPLDQEVLVDNSTRFIDVPVMKVLVLLTEEVEGGRFYIADEPLVPLDSGASAYALAPGKYQIRWQCENYETQEKEIEVGSSKVEVFFDAVPKRTLVRFEPPVPGLRVFRESEEVELELDSNRSGFLLQPGTHQLRLERPGYLAKEKMVSVGRDPTTIAIDTWMMGIKLESSVPGTKFQVNGQVLSPIADDSNVFALPDGVYDIQASAGGYEPHVQRVEVPPKDPAYVFPLHVRASLSTIPDDYYQDGKIVVRVHPPTVEGRELQVGEKWFAIRNGIGQLDRTALDPKEERWPFVLKIDEKRSLRGEFTRKQLEEHGTRPTLEISIPLTNEEVGRKIWLMARPNIKLNKEQSEAALTEAIALAPTNFEIYRDRAICRFELRKYSDAEKDIAVCLENIPNDYLVQCYGALIAMELGRDKDAEKCIEYAMSIRPQSTFASIIKALLAVRSEQLAKAKEILSQTIPNVVDNYERSISKSLLAHVLAQEGDPRAEKLSREAVLHQQLAGLDVAEVELNRAKCLAVLAQKIGQKDKAEAEKLLSEALRILQETVVEEQNPAFEDFKREKARIRALLNKL